MIMKTYLNILSVCFLTLASFADTPVVSVSVSCHQRWPWNGKVDIDYTIETTNETSAPIFNIAFYGRIDNGEPFRLESLKGEGAKGYVLGSGAKRVTWDASVDKPFTSTQKLSVGVTAQDVTVNARYICLTLSDGTLNLSSEGPDLSNEACKTSQMWFRRVEPGTFVTGSPENEVGHLRNAAAEVQRVMSVTKTFYIAVFEVTQAQYQNITGTNPSTSSPGEMFCPVNNVSYYDLRGRNAGSTWPQFQDYRVDPDSVFYTMRSSVGNSVIFDLPTDSQWELACRAGTTNTWNNGVSWFVAESEANESEPAEPVEGDGEDVEIVEIEAEQRACDNRDLLGWYSENTQYTSCKEIAQKLPNAFGLYDMHGNVWEWCITRAYHGGSYVSADSPGPMTGETRSLRGGAWDEWAVRARVARRFACAPEKGSTGNMKTSSIGFRPAIIIQ